MPNIKTGKNVNCKQCGKIFYVNRGRLENGYGQYCSVQCQNKGYVPWNKGLTKDQDERLQSISRKASEQIKIQYENGIRDRFEITKKAVEAVRRKSREQYEKAPKTCISIRGYRQIYIPQEGWINEHQYVWRQTHGPIPEGMHLHHINFNRLDNRLENLKLVTPQEHNKIHKRPINPKNGRFIKEGDE